MKKLILISCLLLTATNSYAQAPTPSEYVLKVSPTDLDLISDGLQTQPFGKVSPLMIKLRQQIIDQQPKPVVEPPKPEVPK